ncbi:hypothetical protein KUTeg_008616 [Tegillarca granosa]|uniref:ABC transporter domain-containing protein n=1 Tax=Tegillarca granosa TaxID=220873 RepID=A0ABQ9FEH2_TEGGR|nr:hypothetical protein KUTeg_008616 [Tegillarca granosa]
MLYLFGKMPSDSKKKREQKKKEAAKNRGNKKPQNAETNGATNGVSEENGVDDDRCNDVVTDIKEEIEALDIADKHRSVTGVLVSHPDSRDVHINNLAITFHGAVLLQDTKLELNVGRRYGLIGLNGCGKSTLLRALELKEVPIPDHVDIYHLRREMPPSDKTALQAVFEVDQEQSHERLLDIYEHLDEMDADKAEMKASFILHGLGFTKEMQQTKVKNFSGGWRMRIALARALYIKPSLLLLDEPTNHLDLNACVWLEQELKEYKRILVVISHSQDFLNGVCTNIIHFHLQRLKLYGGNYDAYVQTRMELEENQMKRYKWEQDQISHMKTLTFYFPSCGTLPPPVIMVQHVSYKYADDKNYNKYIFKT